MALQATQVSVPTANAIKLAGYRSGRRGLIIANHDATNFIVVGPSTVTLTGATGGIQIKAGTQMTIAGDATVGLAAEEWWAIASTGAVVAGVVEQIA